MRMFPASGRSGRPRWCAAGRALALSLFACGPAQAWDYQLHGFAAQGFALSEGNDVLGHSRGGSLDFTEVGVNGAVDFGHGLLASGQVLARRAGETDDGKPRLDYGLLDYRAWQGDTASAGLRLGKVRLPFGLFNDTRDVVFTRPGILLPDSIYSDLSGQQRSLLFSVEGGQVYGATTLGEHEWSLALTDARPHTLNRDEKRTLFDSGGSSYDAEVSRLWELRLMDEIDGGRWQFAFSYLNAAFGLQTQPPPSFALDADIDIYLLSARYNAPRYSLIAEYMAERVHQRSSYGGMPLDAGSTWSDGGYVQADLHLTPTWTAMARLDAQFADRHDRDGSDCESGSMPQDRHACFTVDSVLGLRWQPGPHWGAWAEYHRIEGYYNKFAAPDNRGREPDPDWGLLLLMLGYRF